ncbi:MAG: SRPBCC domain-containing protein [Gemmatimonadota bacterium]
MADPIIQQTHGRFSLQCSVSIHIQASASSVWKILTDARDYPRWNSTVTAIEGEIRDGERIKVRVPGTDRAFTPIVSDVASSEGMTWTGGFAPMFKGVRTFALTERGDGTTDFRMVERFAGLMIPLVRKSLPDFGPIFAQYANDLKHEAESKQL